MAGQSLEHAIMFLGSRRMFQGRMRLQEAITDLQHASAYLQKSGKYPNLAAYVGALIVFYRGELVKVLRPGVAPMVAEELYGAQGKLLAADPILTPSAAN